MDALETKLRAILAQYKTITSPLSADSDDTDGEDLELVLGNLKRDEKASFPRVSWVETGGVFEAPRGASGDNEPERRSMWCRLEVQVWRETVEDCRNCCFNLIEAASKAIDVADLKWGEYSREEERHMNGGFIFDLALQIRVPAPMYGTRGRHQVTLRLHSSTHVSDNDTDVDLAGEAPE